MYIVTFLKELGDFHPVFKGEIDWVVAIFESETPAIELARELNNMPTINITVERFQVWHNADTKFKTFLKKKSKLIYPNQINKL